MKTRFFEKFDYVSFLSNIIAVILGIVITFSIQALIDKKKEKKNITSALILVRDELSTSRSELASCADFLDLEGKGAEYIINNRKDLVACPEDSISKYGYAVLFEMVLTQTKDALELLKTSSLFQSIGDNTLSLKIIRAYDQCDALALIFNRHERQKGDNFNALMNHTSVEGLLNTSGNISLTEILKHEEGVYTIANLRGSIGDTIRSGLSDLDSAIAAIDEYVR